MGLEGILRNLQQRNVSLSTAEEIARNNTGFQSAVLFESKFRKFIFQNETLKAMVKRGYPRTAWLQPIHSVD